MELLAGGRVPHLPSPLREQSRSRGRLRRPRQHREGSAAAEGGPAPVTLTRGKNREKILKRFKKKKILKTHIKCYKYL